MYIAYDRNVRKDQVLRANHDCSKKPL